jgi:hypothetical protein
VIFAGLGGQLRSGAGIDRECARASRQVQGR